MTHLSSNLQTGDISKITISTWVYISTDAVTAAFGLDFLVASWRSLWSAS